MPPTAACPPPPPKKKPLLPFFRLVERGCFSCSVCTTASSPWKGTGKVRWSVRPSAVRASAKYTAVRTRLLYLPARPERGDVERQVHEAAVGYGRRQHPPPLRPDQEQPVAGPHRGRRHAPLHHHQEHLPPGRHNVVGKSNDIDETPGRGGGVERMSVQRAVGLSFGTRGRMLSRQKLTISAERCNSGRTPVLSSQPCRLR